MSIIDRRNLKKKSVVNRQRFIKRYKRHIQRKVADISRNKGITDAAENRDITLDKEDVTEPNFRNDSTRGRKKHVLTGNETLGKGDQIKRPPEEQGQGAGDSGEDTDSFTFTLTKEEFLDIYFADLHLPDFIKESLIGSDKYKWKRHGYNKDGTPSRLDLLKTLKQALARRIATKSSRYLDDIDLRYKHYTKQPYPIKEAVMFCLMDVSGSMGETEKDWSKRFFLLVYLFLEKNYQKVTVRFIRHTSEAEEVDEQEFFYGRKSGGTIVSSGLNAILDIIDRDYDLTTTNIYVTQASDGDNFGIDSEPTLVALEKLLSKVQYMAYIQVETYTASRFYRGTSLYTLYHDMIKSHKNFNGAVVQGASEIYPALRELFGDTE